MSKIEGKQILVTGPAGQIAFPLAARLAKYLKKNPERLAPLIAQP